MGIPGLMTYINQRGDCHLKPFELHDTHLVIDGNALSAQLYNRYAKCNCSFGGDYDEFSRTVCLFFDSLAKCNVTPLVLIDGGCEEKKIRTQRKRNREKTILAYGYNPTMQRRNKFLPLLHNDVLKESMSKMRVKYFQTLFEADDEIASVARILNYPVLSFDSDFFIYDVMYIPFNTLDPFLVEFRRGRYIKQCKIYKVDSLLNQFKGLDRLHLPLAATLLGNDYVNRSTFKEFFKHLKIPRATKSQYNKEQCRIEATFLWLRKHTINSAIAQVLLRLPQDSRKRIQEVIEMSINAYTTSNPQILVSFGYSPQFVSEKTNMCRKQPFRFLEDINKIRLEEEPEKKDEEGIDVGDLVDEVEEEDHLDFQYDSNIQKMVPPWFIDEFNMGHFSSYFIDFFTCHFYVCRTQIEDFSHPAAVTISAKIISVIYGLLTKGLPGPKSLSYLCRKSVPASLTIDKMDKIVVLNQLEGRENMFNYDLPCLANLRKEPIQIRKRILEETLGISNAGLDTFPNEWKLYIATAIFWMSQQEKSFEMNCHLNSLLFGMLFGIVDQRIGCHRFPNQFYQKYNQQIQAIQRNRRYSLNQFNPNVTVFQAYREVLDEDCLVLVPFLMTNFKIDRSLFTDKTRFNVSIVHGFAQFQVCLRHSLHLNALLGFPYHQTRVSELFNGTLLYNLCLNFKGVNDVNAFIGHELQHSPSLLRLFNVLLRNVQQHLKTDVQENEYNERRKRMRHDRSRNFSSYRGVNNRYPPMRHYQM